MSHSATSSRGPWSRSLKPLGVMAAILALGLTFLAQAEDKKVPAQENKEQRSPLFPKTEPAKNSTELHLLQDEGKVVGWIGGEKSYAGKEVTVEQGRTVSKLKIKADNTFVWPYNVKEPAMARFRVGSLDRSVELLPRKPLEPAVFFVVDRTVYRPGQKLHFAGYLRQPDSKGEFMPVAGRVVEVHLTSKKRKTLATKWDLTSDDFGRISGAYQFAKGDALDEYELSVVDFKGTAVVKQAEFRKSKVKFQITSEQKGEKLTLKFQGVDFLNNPVAASQAQFTLQIVRQKEKQEKENKLNPKEFVYASRADESHFLDLESLNEEQRLLWEAGIVPFAQFGNAKARVISQSQGKLVMKGKDPATHSTTLQKEWLKGNHSLIVQGTLIDENGREQRSTVRIPIRPTLKKKEESRSQVKLELSHRFYAVNEPIHLRAIVTDDKGHMTGGQSAVVAMQLSPVVPQVQPLYWGNGFNQFGGWGRGYYPPNGFRGRYALQQLAGHRPTEQSTISRHMITAAPFRGDTAVFKLPNPGAYKLVVVTQLKNGKELRSEIGCVVRGEKLTSGLSLDLDQRELVSGGTITGTLHSQYRNAIVLLTVRDSLGIQFWKPLRVNGSMLKIKETLPEDLRYASVVEAQYIEDGRIDLVSRVLKVIPESKMLKITTQLPKTSEPGAKVKMGIAVNRKEAIDLVVSVYDQSLLGIAPDRSVDIRNFFLADDRARHNHALDIVRRQLHGISVSHLMAKAKKLLEKHRKTKGADVTQWNQLVQHYRSGFFYARDILTLLRLAGVNIYPQFYHSTGTHWYVRLPKDEAGRKQLRLTDLMTKKQSKWHLRLQGHNDLLLLSELHPHYTSQALSSMQFIDPFSNQMGYRGARGDAHRSISGNGFYSRQSGQAFLSQMPATGVKPLEVDGAGGGFSVRRDFSDLAYWNALVRTDKDGKAAVEFKLPDSLTHWRVVVTAVSRDMHVGQHKASFRTFKPVMVWPMVPRIFTEGDKVELFARVHNRTEDRQTIRVKAKVDNGKLLTRPEITIEVPAKSSAPVYWTYAPGKAGFTQILMSAECKAGSDASLKRLPVTKLAAEQTINVSGMCGEKAIFQIPDGVNIETARLDVRFVPSIAADLLDTLDYLVEYPYGCVEQTMSRFLPAIKVAQTLKALGIEHASLKKKLPKCVEGGIKRLLNLQRSDGGWAWQGKGSTHEMMTPYALYGLLQAEKAGYEIPNALAIQKGLDRLKQFIQSMGERQATDRIYCMYVYSHRKPIEKDWWKFIEVQMDKKLSDYALALALEMAVQAGKKEVAKGLAGRLHARVTQKEGHCYWTTARFSRWGNDRFEITAVVLKALVAYDMKDNLIPGILSFFTDTKRGHRWNSTKDTAMIVYALCDYLGRKNINPKERQVVTFSLNNGKARTVVLDEGLSKKVTFTGRELKEGQNELSFLKKTPGVMYRLVYHYWKSGEKLTPVANGLRVHRRFFLLNDRGAQVRELKWGDAIPRGAYIQSVVQASVPNPNTRLRYVLVENPKPSCCEIQPTTDPRFSQSGTTCALREEKTWAVVYHHEETQGSIYDVCALRAELAGDYYVPPAFAELMYQTETCGHSGSFYLKVVDKEKK